MAAARRRIVWLRRMQKLLVKPNGIRRVLNSVAELRGQYELRGKSKKEFDKGLEDAILAVISAKEEKSKS